MTALAAVLAFAALFALTGFVPLKGEGEGGCGACAHADRGGCSTGGCELKGPAEDGLATGPTGRTGRPR